MQVQQQRPESPMVALTWHVCKYKVHKLHQVHKLNFSFSEVNRETTWVHPEELETKARCTPVSSNLMHDAAGMNIVISNLKQHVTLLA